LDAIGKISALVTVVFAFVAFSATGRADTEAISQEALQAKAQYCKACHGSSGQGRDGSSPIPRLAGQQVAYIENQLKAFADRRRDSEKMHEVSHQLSDEWRTALATHFRDLDVAPVIGMSPELVAAGRKIYEQGVPDKVVRCALCHGATARGDGGIPRLAGQISNYIIRKLTRWGKERGQNPAQRDASSIMRPVVHGLTKSQIEEVAAYLSSLP